jgi:hypothetical protein
MWLKRNKDASEFLKCLRENEKELLPQLTFRYTPNGQQNLGRPKQRWTEEEHPGIHTSSL